MDTKPIGHDSQNYFDQNQNTIQLNRNIVFDAEVTLSNSPPLTIEASHIRPHLSLLPESLDDWTIESANLQKSLMSSIRSSQPPSLFVYPSALKNTVSKITTVKITIDSTNFDVPVEQLFCSGHFCDLLSKMTISSSWIKSTVPTIGVEDKYSSEARVELINFLKARTSEDRKMALQGTPIPTLVDLYQLSEDLKIPALKALVCENIEKLTISETNCVQLLNASITSKLKKKQAACLKFIKDKKVSSCLLQAVQHNLPLAAEELAKKDTGAWYADNDFAAITKAILQKNVKFTTILLKPANLVKLNKNLSEEVKDLANQTHAETLINKALESGDPKTLEVVLSAVKKAFPKKLSGWIKIEKALAHETPDLWSVVYQVCPKHKDLWGPKEKPLYYTVIQKGFTHWIDKFIELDIYAQYTKAFHHITDPQVLRFFLGEGDSGVKVVHNKLDISKLLLTKHEGRTPFATAMGRQSSDMAIALLGAHKSHNVSIDANAFTFTHLKVVTDWIAKNGSQQQKNALLEWAVFLRKKGPRPDIAHKMLEAGANPNLISNEVSILDKLVDTHLYKMGEHLFAKVNADVKYNAVTKALIKKRWDWLGVFIDQGFWKEWSDNKGLTLLHCVANEGRNELVKKLLELGANPYQEDLNGSTAFDLAKDKSVFDSETCAIS